MERPYGDGPTPTPASARGERTREHWWLVRLAWLIPLALAILGTTLTADPRGHGTHEQLGLPRCVTRDWTGLPCPACGVTTAVVEFTHGHPLRSFVTQPFGFLLALLAPLFFLWAQRAHLQGRDTWRILMTRVPDHWVRWLLAAGLFGWLWKIGLERIPPGSA